LVARIAANNAVIERINKKGLPDGAKWVPCAELWRAELRAGDTQSVRLAGASAMTR
jgi:uncharacterized protein (DUF2237 family)